jgi:hypothetical protein
MNSRVKFCLQVVEGVTGINIAPRTRMRRNLIATSTFTCLLILAVCAYAQESSGQVSQPSTAQIQSLIDKLRSDEDSTRFEAAKSLAKIGREATPLLGEALNKEKGYARVYAARALRDIEPDNQAVQSTLIAVTKDKQEKLEVRRYAAYILALSPSGVPALVKMLDADDSFVRRSAAFALNELFDVSGYLPATYKTPLTDAIPILIASLGDEDSIVRGVAAEAVEQINGDIDFGLEYAVEKSPNQILVQMAKEVLERRKTSKKQSRQQITMEMKPGAEEAMKNNKNFLRGNLGVIYALAIGGEPVQDFRTPLGTVGDTSLRVTFNPLTRRASSGLSRFNPYEDMR